MPTSSSPPEPQYCFIEVIDPHLGFSAVGLVHAEFVIHYKIDLYV